MSLREDLMARFADLGQIPNEAIVQEVIRQMEYSRSKGRSEALDVRGVHSYFDELSSAPENWRPK